MLQCCWLFYCCWQKRLTWLGKKRWVVVGMTVLLGFGVLWYGWITLHIVPQLHRQGQGYMTSDWQQSETLAAVRSLPENTTLVTNQDMLVLLWTGRAAYPLKEIYLDQPLAEFSKYGEGELTNDKGQQLFRQNRATLVLFDTISDQFYGLYGEQTQERVQVLT